ncbi:WalW protein [Marinobacter sp. chi1]|uniref:WalW protein n=1 Tax=Marinobacter suaedae TaxID=3057675 RepID=A0ABT8W2Z8_9GAMM|nr:WalW protein [Marinobacter sp. chi1]MDO3722586.1 WalW protein [Marinobacter sp. chi1]
MREIKFVLSIDTEEEWDWEGPFPNRVISVENVSHLSTFQRQVRGMGLRPTYFLDYAVIENEYSRQILADLYKSEPEIEYGAHLHPWVTPPVVHAGSEASSHIVNLPMDTVSAQLRSLTKAIENVTGQKPTSFRSGRWGITDPILQELAKQGYLVDSSIYPFYETEWFSCADYDSWPLTMSHLGTTPELIELPVTAGFNHRPFGKAQSLHQTLEKPEWARFRVIGALWALRLHRKIYLSPELSSARDMIALCKQMLETDCPVIHMYLHSSSLLPGSTRYVQSESDKSRLMMRIEKVVNFLRSQCHLKAETITNAALGLRERGELKAHDENTVCSGLSQLVFRD